METLEDVPEFFDDLPLVERMISTLRSDGPSSSRELAESLGANPRSIQTLLSKDRRFANQNNMWSVER